MIKAPVITGSAFRLILSGLLLSLFFSFSESGAAGQKADYLIIEKPSALHILNQFQMRIEKNNIILNSQFVPFRIVEEDIILSDKITSAHKVEFDHKPYYLILDEKDRLLGQDLCGLVIKETNCVTLGDSIKTLSDRIRALPDPRTSTSVSLPGQNTYYRIYQKGRRFALLQEGKPLKFFWSRLTPVSEWEIIRPVTARKSISSSGIEKKNKRKI
ncbi:MAG: hypothetical protein JXB44_04475 [Calditrichaceae bacterium]|nr:hypothetical protein [Calditrichaceae bacterium]RQV96281.1 MAG: hypothetical protein EH224_04955 [Calditrichota bacterium]